MKKNLLILLCIVLYSSKIHSQTNWELLNPKPTASNGKDVDFVNSTTGYIITTNEILETTDAGNTWLKKQDISSGNDMSFYDTTGYIVGNYGYVLKSTDSGKTWNQVSNGLNGDFNTVNIIDQNIVILSTSYSLIKTDDGGTTWETLNIPNVKVNKTWFINSLVGIAVCDEGTILKTIDGGQNWYTTESTNTRPSNFFTVYFINENIGFASREHNEIFRTTDAGETWVKNSSIHAIYDFHFLDENTGFMTGEYGATYKTTDGGITWNPILFQNGIIVPTSMYGIYFHDSNVGYATGFRGQIIKTNDGGNTWTQYAETYNDFNQLQFINNSTGYAQSGNDLFKTTNGGDSWSLVGSIDPSSYVTVTGFTFVNENLGYAAAGGPTGGEVYKTTNGGVTWTALNIGYNLIDSRLNSIFFLDENNGFVSGGFNSRSVLKTTNGGVSWTQVETIAFGQIQFINNQIGYAHRIGHSNGRMYKTIDGGNTWNVSIEVDRHITAFHFVDENIGYFVGEEHLMYKTIDGGKNWTELKVPYLWFTEINFYSKNVGYIADEYGKLYKTENGGISWGYLTEQYKINSIELVGNKIFTAGANGKIYRSDITYRPMVLQLNQAANISNSSANLTGSVTSNGAPISNIHFEYGIDPTLDNMTSTTPGAVNTGESLSISFDISGLESNTTYYYRLAGIQNSNTGYSQILSFTTLSDYEITTYMSYDYYATTAEISGEIVSNEHEITNVEFQYGLSSDALTHSISGTPASVPGNSRVDVRASLTDLEPETEYYYRVKANHQGKDIYGNILFIKTKPEYQINLGFPEINGADVTLSSYLTSYGQPITNIAFEYGIVNYENSISTNPSQIDAYNNVYLSTTIKNLDTQSIYYYRLKAIHNGEVIYSVERVFNFSGDIILVSGTTKETQTNSLELRGLINSYGAYLTDIHFEYGVTSSFGSTISVSPNYVAGYNTNLFTAIIDNPLPNQTYFYRLVATSNGNKIYSDTYQFTTSTLSIPAYDLEKEMTIYPNPATDFVKIKSRGSDQVRSVEIFNALGQRAYYKDFSNVSDTIIDVSKLRKGTYFMKVNFESAKVVSSVLIFN